MLEKIYITPDQIDIVDCQKECQETTVNFLRDDTHMIICSSDNTFITSMKHVLEKDPENYKCYYYKNNIDPKTGRVGNYFFEAPKNLLVFRTIRKKREFSEEDRKKIGERLKKGKYEKEKEEHKS